MNKLILVILLMLITWVTYAQVYKWIDSQGVTHFSDRPHDGAEKLKLPDAQTYSPPTPNQDILTDLEEKSEVKKRKYTKLAIAQPLDQATIRNNQGDVVVSVRLEPGLSPNDKVQLIYDGSPLGAPQPDLIFELHGLYRGSHTIKAQIVNANGDVILTSEPITIYMQRPRVGMGGGI